jgi:dTDP-4-dehydrorhamnose reductase
MVNELAARGHAVLATDIIERSARTFFDVESAAARVPYAVLDITDADAVDRLLTEHAPDAVVHCAAWTAVDLAEMPENRDRVMAINVTGTENLARACKRVGAKMVYISTDYVFDGEGETPWKPDDKAYAPLNVYGESKLLGERAVTAQLDAYFIVRIAWVFGVNGKNFVRTMLQLSEKYPTLRVVSDQIGTPTYTFDLARLLADMLETDRYGYYHATNEGGYISWYDFACEIFRAAGKTVAVQPVTTAEYGVKGARRPFNSRLDKSKLTECGFVPLRDWREALGHYIGIITNEQKKER